MSILELRSFKNHKYGYVKPSHGSYDYLMETEYYRIAKFFGLKASKCIMLDSYNLASLICHTQRFKQVDGPKLFKTSTFEEMFPMLSPSVQRSLLLLAFVDCVCGNMNRHIGNISFLMGDDGDIVKLCPPYSNIAVFENATNNDCLLCPDSSMEWSHAKVFCWLKENWKEFDKLYKKYTSEEFDALIEPLYMKKWIQSQRRKLCKNIKA